MAHGAAVPLHVAWGGRRGEGGDLDQEDDDDVPEQDQDDVEDGDFPGQCEDLRDSLVRSLGKDVVKM